MSKQEKGLIPELRFPEFQPSSGWDAVYGNKAFEQVSNKDHNSDLPILAITQEYGAIPREMIDYNVSVTEKSVQSYKVVDVGDFIISLRSFQGGIEYSEYKGLCSPAYVILRTKKGIDKRFFKQYFKAKSFIRDLTKNLEGLRDGKMISYKQFSEVLLPKPSTEEQQKIADCLASIDELITLHTKKLEAFKDHKKGLMQQLFPAEGENVPKLRFPEFLSVWSLSRLENVSSKVMVGIASAATHAYRDKGVVLFRNQNIKDGYLDDSDILFIDADYEKSHKNKRLMPGDLLTARTGYPGVTCVVPKKYKGSQSFTTLITRPIQSIIDPRFLCFYINSDRGQAFFESAQIGGGQKNVNAKSLSEMPIPYPELTEQQKIADFLSAIDEQINAQSQEVESLKSHKEGLVQKLFPVMDEVV